MAQQLNNFIKALHEVPGRVPALYVISYAAMAKNALPQSDFDALLEASIQAEKILERAGAPIDYSIPQPWPKDAERVRMQVRARYDAYPKIAENFKAFVENVRAAREGQ